jgi:hypothetical protein
MIQLAIPVGPGKALAISMCFGIFKLSKLSNFGKVLAKCMYFGRFGLSKLCRGGGEVNSENDGLG